MPLAWLGLGFALGLIAVSGNAPHGGALTLWLLALAGGYATARRAGLRVGGAALILAGALLGMLRAEGSTLDASAPFSDHYGSTVEMSGSVNGVVEAVGARVRFTLDLTSIDRADATGKAIAWAGLDVPNVDGRTFPYLEHGDAVRFAGRVEAAEAIGTFDYPEHLAAKGVGAIINIDGPLEVTQAVGESVLGAIHGLRANLARVIQRHVPEPQAAVVNALVLGLRGGTGSGTSDDFRRSGLSHLLAVSGLHVGVLLMLVLGASARIIGRHHLAYLAPPLALLWLYVLLAGAPPSAVRAGAMGTAFLLALATGRAAVPINALGLTAVVVLALDPGTLYDRSFQLSATAMAGVLFIGLPLAKRALERGDGHATPGALALTYVLAPIAVSTGAVVGSLPLVAYNFGQVPLLSIPATLIAMPLLPPLLVSGFLTGIAGFGAPWLGTVLGVIPSLLGWLLVRVADIVARVPFAAFDTEIGVEWVWAGYGLLALAALVVHRRRWLPSAVDVASVVWRGPQRRLSSALLIVAFASLAATPWAMLAFDGGDGMLHVHFLDVGQGDSSLIVTPGGATVLIDGGRDPRRTINAIDSVLGGRVRIDVGVITHPDSDHADGVLELARRGRTGVVLFGPSLNEEAVRQREGLDGVTTVIEASSGMRIEVEDGVVLEILHPPMPPLLGTGADENNNSVSLLLTWEDASVLFTGDLETAGEAILIEAGVDADVLQVGHHGANTSSGAMFLEAVTPIAAVISAGKDNPFGHPSPTVVDRLEAHAGEWLFNTAEHGTVELSTNGAEWFAQR